MHEFTLEKNCLVIDIGSNDGTLLRNFVQKGFSVLGIEPASNIAQLANSNGVRTMNAFFGKQAALQAVNQFGKARAITATNVFAHVDNIQDFVEGIDCLLGERGVFVIEVPYLLNLVEGLEFDTIYHEHLSYFSLHPLRELFKKFNMHIVKAKVVGIHGGSLRIFVQKEKPASSAELDVLMRKEEVFGVKDVSAYFDFAKRVVHLREKLLHILREVKSANKKISGYGATAKSTTLLHYCNIGNDFIDYVLDATPLKQGKYTPGTHIPIVSGEVFKNNPPDYALLLAWNYYLHILEKEKAYRSKGGKFILPIPEPKII
ncbi:class I SAM-dependent methyltransferase [Candidatus Omnitrophota bacterium]